ncbi:Uncharacterized protein dnl_35240 [Desulfonema limicola]|uniref:Uncharacterized protein n=1 Tax=Desulfonema limicola TaxID=45656 RepID=A0A975GHX8_9BACT|nr:hypothetical protein [Desulfonema limicola]QTA81193.1 Uncharacterized protein dnl_35240 [Desulfonema limicola]
MLKKTMIIDLETSFCARRKKDIQEITLRSGRMISAKSDNNQDILEIREPGGQMIVKMRLTDTGPVMVIEGTRLELKSAESIALQSKKIEIDALEEAVIKSRGKLEINSSKEMKVKSDDDLRLTGKIIHIN